ncbi:MAG: hypothetical protein HY331_07005 [Chloroflexi bacterium]|nr:hypothetical protein [Chloroflexota bacterium]
MDTTLLLSTALAVLAGGLAGALASAMMVGRWWAEDRRRRVRRVQQAVLNELRYNLRAAEYNRVTNRPELLAYRADALRMALFDPDRSIDFGRRAEPAALAYLDQIEVATLFFTINGLVQPTADAERWRAEATKGAELLADRAAQLQAVWKPAQEQERKGSLRSPDG